jgi:hypothetical protein
MSVMRVRSNRTTTLPSDSSGQFFCPPASLRTGILRAHITSMENPTSELSGIRRDVAGIQWFAGNTSSVRDNLLVWIPSSTQSSLHLGRHNRTSPVRSIGDKIAHRVYNNCSCTAVDTSAEREEVTLSPRATKIIPKPTSRP